MIKWQNAKLISQSVRPGERGERRSLSAKSRRVKNCAKCLTKCASLASAKSRQAQKGRLGQVAESSQVSDQVKLNPSSVNFIELFFEWCFKSSGTSFCIKSRHFWVKTPVDVY